MEADFFDDEPVEAVPVVQEEDIVMASLQKNNDSFQELTKDFKEEKKMTANERVERAAEALRDASEAYKIAGVPAQSEDIRALAITFMIDEGKNGRMTTVRQERTVSAPVVASSAPAPAYQPSAQRTRLKFTEGQTYLITATKVVGNTTNKFGGTSTEFEALDGATPVVIGTSGKLAKALTANINVPLTITVKKEANYVKYSAVDKNGVEQVR